MADYEPTDLAERDAANEERSQTNQRERQDEIGDFKWLMGQKRGRRIVRRLLDFTGINRSSFSNSGSQTFFNEGQRNVGLKLLLMINSDCTDEYVLMLKEHQDNVRHADDRQPNAQ